EAIHNDDGPTYRTVDQGIIHLRPCRPRSALDCCGLHLGQHLDGESLWIYVVNHRVAIRTQQNEVLESPSLIFSHPGVITRSAWTRSLYVTDSGHYRLPIRVNQALF